MPEHETYVEPFLGGGSVLLNKPKSQREIVADVDRELINFWRWFQAFDQWSGMLHGLPYDEDVFRRAAAWCQSEHPLSRAVGFFVRNRMSRGGLGKSFAWSERLRGKQRSGGPIPGDVNAWETCLALLPAIRDRIRGVWFHCDDAFAIIRYYDAPGVLFYCDPPYLPETRTHRTAYVCEMTRGKHLAFLDTLRACRGRVMVSGYRSALYDEALADWRRIEWDLPNHSGQGKMKQRRTETLWLNFTDGGAA